MTEGERREIQPVEFFDDRMRSLVSVGTAVRRLAGGGIWTEGPLYLPNTDRVIWSDIPNNRILSCRAEDGGDVVEWRRPSNFANGHTLDHEGRVLHCSHGARAILRTEHDGSVTTLVSHVDGARLNSPNDLIVATDGAIWFTDPPYGILSDVEGYKADSELDGCYVYRFEPDTERIDPVVTDMIYPNGLALTADESVLYVSDTSVVPMGENGQHHLRAYDIVKTGDSFRATSGRVFAEIEPGAPDGFRLDRFGNLFTSSRDAIQVFAPDATMIGRIPVPETVSNCCFGGRDRTVLFITASTSLYAIDLLVNDGR